MDFGSLKAFGDTVVEAHNSTPGFSVEIIVSSFVIYHKVWKRISAKVSSSFQTLIKSLEIHSNTLNEHTKQLAEQSEKIENHEKRIVVLETKP